MAPSQYRYVVLDVFTTTPFTGNQLAIVHLPNEEVLTRETRHAIAKEFNLSETVFLYDVPSGSASETERKAEIWTPFAELPFAGHPTIGTAWYCGSHYGLQQFELQLRAGPVTASFDEKTSMATALIPHNVHVHTNPIPVPAVLRTQPLLEEHVGLAGLQQLGSHFPLVSIVKGLSFVLAELPTVEDHLRRVQVSSLTVDEVQQDAGWESTVLAPYFYVRLPPVPGQPQLTRLRTRMLEAHIGEDPATGSAACTLCSWLSLQRGEPGASYAFELEQGVEMGRRSVIRVSVTLDGSGRGVERVRLEGSAVATMSGVLSA